VGGLTLHQHQFLIFAFVLAMIDSIMTMIIIHMYYVVVNTKDSGGCDYTSVSNRSVCAARACAVPRSARNRGSWV
jgi:hypothetical protein